MPLRMTKRRQKSNESPKASVIVFDMSHTLQRSTNWTLPVRKLTSGDLLLEVAWHSLLPECRCEWIG